MILLESLYLVLLFPLPWILRALLPKASGSTGSMLKVPFFEDIREVAGQRHTRSTKKPLGFRLTLLAIWTLLVIAAANPQYIGEPIAINSEARDLMLAVDVSDSMRTRDLRIKGERVDRLEVVKAVLKEFIKRRQTDRLGLIVFGDRAYLQTPLTFDNKTLGTLLDETFIGIAGPRTAMGDAIGLALKRLQDRPTQSKVLILLTDGQNTAGEIDPITAAQLAAEKGLKIYTIGVGADEIVTQGIFGFGARRLNPSADLDEKTLIQIAKLTGGEYFRAKNTEQLRRIYELLDELEPAQADAETFRPIRSLFYWPLGLALVLVGLMSLHAIARSQLNELQARKQFSDDPSTTPSRLN